MQIPQILQQLSGRQKLTVPPQIKQMISYIRMSQDPQAAFTQLIRTNPQLQQVMQLINTSGKDPMSLFTTMAEKNGLDAQEILDLLK